MLFLNVDKVMNLLIIAIIVSFILVYVLLQIFLKHEYSFRANIVKK